MGATVARDLPVPGRELNGVHQAMDYLPIANRVQQGDVYAPSIDAQGKHVIIIGGGDTGADCLGTAHRQGAASVTQLEILPRPPDTRAEENPWPQWSMILRTSSAHEEGGERVFSVNTERFIGDDDGNVTALRLHEVELRDGKFTKIDGTDRELPADLVLLAMGFLGPDTGAAGDGDSDAGANGSDGSNGSNGSNGSDGSNGSNGASASSGRGWIEQLGVAIDQRGNIARDNDFMTNVPGVFVAGDCGRGQSLIVWAIAEGRSCAAGVDRWLMGETALPAPIAPTARPLT
jgi:glutamate synthase (NADPH) small chain